MSPQERMPETSVEHVEAYPTRCCADEDVCGICGGRLCEFHDDAVTFCDAAMHCRGSDVHCTGEDGCPGCRDIAIYDAASEAGDAARKGEW